MICSILMSNVLTRLLQLGLIAYTTLMLVPIFNNNAGIHQWNIQGKHLIEWSKVFKSTVHSKPTINGSRDARWQTG